MHHILMDLYIVHPMHNLKLLETFMIRPNMNLAMIACGLFVLISGATIAFNKRDESLCEFYKKRFTRVLIPFYIVYIIYFIIKVISLKTLSIYGEVPKWRFIFTIFGMDEYISANGIRTFSLGIGEWFLGCIILCYLAFPLLYNAHKKNKILTFIVMTAYFLYINFNYGRYGFAIASHMNFFCQIYNFYLGILLIDKNVINKFNKSLLFITIPVVLFFYLYNVMLLIPDNIKTTIVIVSLFITFYEFESEIQKSDFLKKIINFFNKISFEIFLVHHSIIYQVDFVLNYRRISGIETLFVIVFDLVLTIIIAMLVKGLSGKVYALADKRRN